ncbi:MAG: methylated-DNA--[protein]-cysteine S-methyltransferase [Lapillicoccus sp.]
MSTAPTTASAPATPTWHTELDSPVGALTVVRDSEGVTGVYFPQHWTRPDPTLFGRSGDSGFEQVAQELEEYFAGERRVFEVATHRLGTVFQRRVWSLIDAIPYGATSTYGQLSAAIGPGAHPRAVGNAVGHNPLSILVACHRVVGATGLLTGYAGGLDRKRALLVLEGARVVSGSAEAEPTLFSSLSPYP